MGTAKIHGSNGMVITMRGKMREGIQYNLTTVQSIAWGMVDYGKASGYDKWKLEQHVMKELRRYHIKLNRMANRNIYHGHITHELWDHPRRIGKKKYEWRWVSSGTITTCCKIALDRINGVVR